MTAVDLSAFIVLRRFVRLAGHVRRADGTVAGGGHVRLDPANEAPVARTPRKGTTGEPARRAHARSFVSPVRLDGLYFFMDVPAGDYSVSGSDLRGRPAQRRQVSVPARVEPGNEPLLDFDLEIAAD